MKPLLKIIPVFLFSLLCMAWNGPYCKTTTADIFRIGDLFCPFFWTHSDQDTVTYGYYGVSKILKKIENDTLTVYNARLRLESNGWWQKIVNSLNAPLIISFYNQKPAQIDLCADKFAASPWLHTIAGQTDTADYTIRFAFPVLPTDQSYGLYDYFSVHVNDTMDVQFQGINDSTMTGSFVNRRVPGSKTIVYAKNAIAVRTTVTNAFRIRSIQIDGAYERLASAFLSFDLSKLKESAGYYGLHFIDTADVEQPVTVTSIKIAGMPTLYADSTYRLSWSLTGANTVAYCSLYVSLDSAASWTPIGKTAGADTSFNWPTPSQDASRCFLRVRAFDIDGQAHDDISDEFVVKKLVSIRNITILGAPALFADSTYRLSWSMDGREHVVHCSLFVSLDSGVSWAAAGITLGSDTTTHWTAPHSQSAHAFLRVMAIGSDLGRYSATSSEFQITIIDSLPPVTNPPQNPFFLRGELLTSASVRLAWSAELPIDTAIKFVAIRYGTLRFPTAMSDTLSLLAGQYSLSDSCDTLSGLAPHQYLYFTLFVANAAGQWSVVTDQSRVLLRTNPVDGEAIVLTTDTLALFNDSVQLWTQPGLMVAYPDTLDRWNSAVSLNGFIAASSGFVLRNGNLPLKTSLGVQLMYQSVPPGFDASDLRLYQYNFYTGNWRLVSGPTVVDTSLRMVSAHCDDARLPFMVLLDTLPPKLALQNSASAYYTIRQRITDTCTIQDNIENVRLRLLGGAGDKEMGDLSAYITPLSSHDRSLISIPPFVADQCSGLRAFIVAEDGRNSQRINLSEAVLRDGANCDDTTALALQWTPLYVTAQPLNTALSAAVLSSSPYDTMSERIIQWMATPQNMTAHDRWVEYDGLRDSSFALTPGKLFWIKSRNERQIEYGSAIVAALKDTFEIKLNPNDWTDFSIPFRGESYLGDILDATRKSAGEAADSIGIYRWKEAGASFITDAVFLAGIDSLSGPTRSLYGGRPYSAFNPLDSQITLRIPPDGVALSPLNPRRTLTKKSTTGSWSVRVGIVCHDSVSLAPIYCASTPSGGAPHWYPLSPSLGTARVAVVNRQTDRLFGNTASGDLLKGGCLFELRCSNPDVKSVPISLMVECAAGLPANMTAGLLAATEKWGKVSDTLRFSLGPQSSVTNYLVIGEDAYVKRTTSQLLSRLTLRVNTFGRGIRLMYTVPYDTRSMHFVMFDLKGRRVWDDAITSDVLAQEGMVMIEKTLATGLYVLELQATVRGERAPRVIRQKVLHVR